ncbi:S4 domain protein YaaA [Halalkalibacter nanhaiisediminis]|uniref:S4 domain protein YaaA n=1 Tax=Halalkalibacter nanhaiisediminis TaxID=688079 RepID=A0A562QS55_9BACI|nr:S4 domain protein YaaA [Halalkalibacter nanhaiisediminis]
MKQIVISTAYITLGQVLKEVGIIDTGGMAKWYLAEHTVYVNGEDENRRGKKLVAGDVLTTADGTEYEIVAN